MLKFKKLSASQPPFRGVCYVDATVATKKNRSRSEAQHWLELRHRGGKGREPAQNEKVVSVGLSPVNAESLRRCAAPTWSHQPRQEFSSEQMAVTNAYP